MATCTIEEFRNDAGLGGFPSEPASVVQTPITPSGSPQPSAAFASDTRWVVLSCEAALRIAFGTTPVAAVTSRYMPAGMYAFGVTPGLKVSVITG